ncbi:hypothetical protein BJY00DRAFT_321444 [Aspergillus carlsbadensis]|nr:hypothetical protein BJY00DRAFT_321444 [Aspergillus carlsbadensis]
MSSPPNGAIDQETADLILRLQLEDTGVYLESCSGKSKDPTDAQVAFELQREHLAAVSQYLIDQRMALSIAAAVQSDDQILARETRGRPRTRTNNAAPLNTNTFAKFQDPRKAARTIGTTYWQPGYPEYDEPESSAWAAGRKPEPEPEPVRLSRCVACQDDVDPLDIAPLPCSHEYCRSCITELFELSLANESLFPPRCCRTTIDLDLARIFLPETLVQLYETKKVEFETPDRTYCCAKSCSAFIPPTLIKRNVATCPACQFTTCRACKGRAHTGDCPTDTELKSSLAVAKRQGWQRCFSCWRVVELVHGRNHITCRCGAEFCYNCGERWGTCSCAEWNEHRLRERAFEILDRDRDRDRAPGGDAGDAGGGGAAKPDEALVEQTVEELRKNHECWHAEGWRRVSGRHRCEECLEWLHNFILECDDCKLRACVRCKRNRL